MQTPIHFLHFSPNPILAITKFRKFQEKWVYASTLSTLETIPHPPFF